MKYKLSYGEIPREIKYWKCGCPELLKKCMEKYMIKTPSLVMTQKDKELLLRDLCARLPYDVKVLYENKVFNVDYISGIYEEIKLDIPDNYTIDIEEVKPYLFPLDSMTEEQRKEYEQIIYKSIELHYQRYYNVVDIDDFDCLMDFYHKNHFDYRGLIPMGLANDATGKNIY